MPRTQKITTCLWFDGQAEEAAHYYVSIFKNSRVVGTTRYDEEASKAAGRPKGSVMTVEFELDGQAMPDPPTGWRAIRPGIRQTGVEIEVRE